jgi:hypothetical protein
MPPPEIEKGDPSYKVAPNRHPSKAPVSQRLYRQDSRSASHKPLRLIRGDESLAERLLRAACDDVRSKPSRLPLWVLRLYEHQRLGRLGYQAIWDALYEAGRENGSDKWVRACLLHGIGQANASTKAPPSMQTLLRGLI